MVALFCLIMLAADTIRADDVDIEKIMDTDDDVNDQSALLDYLDSLIDSPLNVNAASVAQLCTIPWISPVLAARLVQHRYRNGAFRDLVEIKNVKGFSTIYDKISPYLTAGRRPISASFHGQGRHHCYWQVEDAKEFQQKLYSGSKHKLLNRLQFSCTEHIHLGVLGEKDPGERSWSDFRVGHVAVEMPFLSTRVIAGAFSASFGQGLVFGGAYRMRKGGDPVTPAKQRSRALAPYLSAAENEAFFGVAVSSRAGILEMHAFSSHDKKDARVQDGVILTLPSSGLHRTAGEIETHDQLDEFVQGASLEAKCGRSGRIGCSWQNARYASAFPAQKGIRQCLFSGDHNSVAGLHYDLAIGSLNFFGEAAHSHSGGRALVAGVWYDSKIEVVLLFRQYDRDFQNYYACGFGEGAETSNESGVYYGLRYRMGGGTVSFYLDQFLSAWPHTASPMPASGVEMFASIEWELSAVCSASAFFRSESKEKGIAEIDAHGNSSKKMERPRRSRVRWQLTVNPIKSIRLRSRLEFSSFTESEFGQRQPRQLGAFLSQDVRWRPNDIWSLQACCSFFDAPSYETRFYQFENDLPGVMRLKMLNGRGKRSYFLLSCRLSQHLKVHCKYENSWFDNAEAIGSGNDVLFRSCENSLAFQLEWYF